MKILAMRLRISLTIVLGIGLSACGGGGGGSTSGPDAPSPGIPLPTLPATTGLIGASSAPGAILHVDAARLHMLRDKAVRIYRGIDYPSGLAATGIDYSNMVREFAVGNGFSENSSNDFNEGKSSESRPYMFVDGTLKQIESLTMPGTLAPQSIELVYLRSPVRVNDRYVAIDRHFNDTGVDADGDKINDALDLAVWTQVVGEDVLDLPQRNRIKALRIDITARSRVIYSSTKLAGPMFEAIESRWYAPGLGLVKRRSEEAPTREGEARKVSVEELLKWDGGEQGLGYSDYINAVAPARSNLAGKLLPAPLAAVAFDQHAVVMSNLPGEPSAAGLALTQLDGRGRVMASRGYRYAELLGGRIGTNPHLLRVGKELRLLMQTGSGIDMVAVDASGQQLLSAEPVSLNLGPAWNEYRGFLYAYHAIGDRIWLAWLPYPEYREDAGNLADLKLANFDAKGAQIGTTQLLQTGVYGSLLQDLQLTPSGQSMVLTWRYRTMDQDAWNLQAFDLDSGARARGWTLSQAPVTKECNSVEAVGLKSNLALVCRSEAWISTRNTARLNAAGEVERRADGSFILDSLSPPWLRRGAGRGLYFGQAEGMTFAIPQMPASNIASDFDPYTTTVGFAPLVGGILSADEALLLARVPLKQISEPSHLLPVGSNMLLIGRGSYETFDGMRSLMVWR